MANGKPGDHPYTDITIHGLNIFGLGIDAKLRRIEAEGQIELIAVAGTLVGSWPWIDHRPANPHGLAMIVDSLIHLLEAQRSRS
jgi:hypothetical protein